jgi:Na+/proline symporter
VDAEVTVGLILALIVALLILSLPTWPYAAGWGYGYYPAGGFGALLLILLVVLLSRRRV